MIVALITSHPHRCAFTSEILPLYLRGLWTGDFLETLEALPEAAGFSATTISRLLKGWQDEYRVWHKRSLEGRDYVYIWADGVYFNVRLEEDRLACLVIRASGRGVGVLPDGRKEVVAIEDGYREST